VQRSYFRRNNQIVESPTRQINNEQPVYFRRKNQITGSPTLQINNKMKFSLRHQSTGKVYLFIVPVGGYSMFYGYMRKIHVHNQQGVPSDRPVLLAANHPTAFMDPFLLCTFLDPPIYNMTRGDIFQKPFYRKFLESINMFPVFRVRDGYVGRDRNDEVFDYCVDKLYHKRVVTIYVEGEHHLEKRVRPVQKGIARIAFAAYERHRLDDLQIVPAGCNYVSGVRPRDEVMINIGAPIFVKDYWDDYLRDPAGTTQQLCKDIEKALQSVCYHIENEGDDQLAEHLLRLHRSDHPAPPLPVVIYEDRRFAGEKAVLDRLNALPESEKNLLRVRTDRYFAALDKAGLEDATLMNPRWSNWRWSVFFALGLLPWLIGYLSSWPLIRLTEYVADTKAKKREFYSSVRIAVGLLAGMPYYLTLILICLFTGSPWWIALGLSLLLWGWFAQFYMDIWKRWRAARRAARHPQKPELLRLRNEISMLPALT
jgi:1-acyl-sn-glycerol-3-phosphate acyltransferase